MKKNKFLFIIAILLMIIPLLMVCNRKSEWILQYSDNDNYLHTLIIEEGNITPTIDSLKNLGYKIYEIEPY